MDVSYFDSIDSSIIWLSSRTLVLGMSDDSDRQSMTDFFRQHYADVLDLYRDPGLLILKALEFPCFLRVLDLKTYKLIEPALAEYLKGDEDTELTTTVVYGAGRNDLIDSISVINGSRLHPTVLAGYYTFLLRNR